MLLVADHERRFAVESPGAVRDVGSGEEKVFPSRDKLTAREALRIASQADSGARILLDGLTVRPGQLPTVEALASRKLSIACLSVGDEPEPQNREPGADRAKTGAQLTMPLFYSGEG